MDRETFDRILTEEGVKSQKLKDDLWRDCPMKHEELEEDQLRRTAKGFLRAFPNAHKYDPQHPEGVNYE